MTNFIGRMAGKGFLGILSIVITFALLAYFYAYEPEVLTGVSKFSKNVVDSVTKFLDTAFAWRGRAALVADTLAAPRMLMFAVVGFLPKIVFAILGEVIHFCKWLVGPNQAKKSP